MKLFTIGDSISQGFMSMAAARTELSYSTLLARCLGLVPGTDEYPIPLWGAGGLPFNIENLLRSLQRQYGSDIRGPIEWPLAVASVNRFLDDIEDHYERGQGNIALPQAGRRQFYPNVSVAGFTVADAWMVTPKLCIDRIANDQQKGGQDGFFDLPNCRFERTAHAVLNPSRDPQLNGFSQLRWLEHHAQGEGIENVIIWLGSNNALGTVVRMSVKRTKAAGKSPLKMDLDERNEFNLWSPAHFKEEYGELVDRVHTILSKGKTDCRVFIATVPAVTIAPLARGVGNSNPVNDPFGVLTKKALYFDRYTYFIFDLEYARRSGNSITLDEAVEIDTTIAEYNKAIAGLVDEYNRKPRKGVKVEYVLVDICDQLLRLAFKRNDGKPTYKLPKEVEDLNASLGRTVNTVYYTVDRMGKMSAGGIFSLDGVHPTALGHGLIAQEFLDAFGNAGVQTVQNLDWHGIAASDSLYSNPIKLMPELYDNTRLAEMLLDLMRLP